MPQTVLLAIFIPLITYVVCLCFFYQNLVIFAISGALGFLIGAFILWIHSNFLASKYLSEREARDAQRAKDNLSGFTCSDKSNKTLRGRGTRPSHAAWGVVESLILQEEWKKQGGEIKKQNENSIGMPSRASGDTENAGLWFYHKGKKYVGPRTTQRLSPVFPAFLSLIYILLAASNLLTVFLVVIIEMATDEHP